MRRTQLIALLLVAVMAVAILPAAAVAVRQANPEPAVVKTPIVGAPTINTYLTAASSPTVPNRYERYYVTGKLTAPWYMDPMKYKPIKIYWRYSDQISYNYWTTVYTNTNGYYTFTDNEGNHPYVLYKIVYAGDATYKPRTVYLKVYNGKTSTSIHTSPSDPVHNTYFTIYGYVRDAYNVGLENKAVRITRQYRDSGGTWHPVETIGTVYTDDNGRYHISFVSSVYNIFKVEYRAYPYATYSWYWSSSNSKIVDART